jgi:cytochrome c-type biogenesis protein CcmF
MLGLLALATGGALVLYAVRAPALKQGGLFQPISREGGLVLNNLLLSTMCATVFIGTLYPLFVNALGGQTVSVGPPFFNRTFLPLAIPLVVAVGIGPLLPWKRGDLLPALGRLKFVALASAAAMVATYTLQQRGPVMALVGMAAGAWLVCSAIAEVADRTRLGRIPLGQSLSRAASLPRAAWGMTLAHAGLGIAIAGMTGTALWTVERIQAMKPGDSVALSGYQVRLDSVAPVAGPNYDADRATFTVMRDGKTAAVLTPERRTYRPQGQQTYNIGIRTDLVSDIYGVIGDADPGQPGSYVTRLYYHPLVPWIWIGAVVMVLGGLVSLSDRRLRVGAPARRAVQLPAGSAPAAE